MVPEKLKAFAFFEEMCRIPHGSGNEKAISDYLMSFAKERGLSAEQDGENNVLIKKVGTKGLESAAPVILQGHIDMVCEKNAGTPHDFSKDPIALRVNGDYVMAAGTTLGADNCAGVALILALLDADGVPHPPLEAVFTTNEETGMEGAAAFDCSRLKGRRFINLDSEEEGILTVSCAGGTRATLVISALLEAAPAGFVHYKLGVSGLTGGHSGMDIHRERANANKLMARLLNKLNQSLDLRISHVEGGAQDNAIPREAGAIVCFDGADVADAITLVGQCESVFKGEFRAVEDGIVLTAYPLPTAPERVFPKKTADRYITAAMLCPNGVQAMSRDVKGLVETSNNLGVVRTEAGDITLTCALRSSVATRKLLILEQIKLLGAVVGATVTWMGDYPSWEYNPDSPLREAMIGAYRELYGKEPVIQAIHAGLECGLFAGKIPGADMISFGPDISGAHSPEERLSISSFNRAWDLLLATVARL